MHGEGKSDVSGRRGSRPARSRRARWLWLVGGSLALAAGFAVAVASVVPELILSRLREQALRRGVALSDCALSLGFGSAELTGCKFALVPPSRGPGLAPAGLEVQGRLGKLDVILDGVTPRKIVATGPAVTLRGAVELSALGELLSRLPASSASAGTGAGGLSVEALEGTLRWQSAGSSEVPLALSGLKYSSTARTFEADLQLGKQLRGRVLGAVGRFEASLGDVSRPRARLVAQLDAAQSRGRVTLEFDRLPLRELEGSLVDGLSQQARGVAVSGKIALVMPLGLTTEQPRGDLHLTLHGLKMPVPRELAGLVYGDAPRVTAKIAPSRSLQSAKLTDLAVLIGALELRGSGALRGDASGVGFDARVRGPLSCRAIAESAARAHAGSVIARVARRLGRRALAGSVNILAVVAGNTRALDSTRAVTTVGVGCGLKPLPLGDVDLPAELLRRLPPELRKRLPESLELPRLDELSLPKGLPPVPKLPAIPKLPKLPKLRAHEPAESEPRR